VKTIVLTGEPKSTPHIYRNTCRGGFSTTYMTAEGKALKEQYQWEARAHWKGKPLEGNIDVSITLYFGTKRRTDLDNFNKLAHDALTGVIYQDDSQIARLTIARGYDKANSRIEIKIEA
jgi:Holliday junction resolvase RusA-like endonuclease